MFLLNDQGRTIIESASRLNVNQSRPHRFHGTLLLSLSLAFSLSFSLFRLTINQCVFTDALFSPEISSARMGLIKRVINYALPTTWMNAIRPINWATSFFLGHFLVPECARITEMHVTSIHEAKRPQQRPGERIHARGLIRIPGLRHFAILQQPSRMLGNLLTD